MPYSSFFTELAYTHTSARLKRHKKTGYVIVFDVINPTTGKFQRCKRKVNELRRLYPKWSEFYAACNMVCNDYNRKLGEGWSPFVAETTKVVAVPVVKEQVIEEAEEVITLSPFDQARKEREETTVKQGLEKWIAYKNNLREDTLRSYRSLSRMMGEWLDKNYPDLKLKDFSRVHANLFMDFRDLSKIKATTYNNTLGNARAFFAWANEHEYCEINPFDRIKDKEVEEKFRDVIPLEALTRIREYFDKELPQFTTIMLLMYFGGMRPKEISRVRVSQIKLVGRGIEMPGYVTKTKHPRMSPLSQELVERLAATIAYAKPTDYLISKDWMPGETPLSTKSYQKRWQRMRKDLKMPDSYQLYSLRDCSAFYRLESKKIAPLDAMQAMGHKRLFQTLVYANHEVKDLAKRLEDGTPMF